MKLVDELVLLLVHAGLAPKWCLSVPTISRAPSAEARAIIVTGRGKHFDPDITDAFLAGFDDFVAIAERHR